MAVHDVQAVTISSTEFRFTSADGLHVACNRWNGSMNEINRDEVVANLLAWITAVVERRKAKLQPGARGTMFSQFIREGQSDN